MVNLRSAAKAPASDLSARKRAAIQRAGTAVFLRHGYGSASMDAIAAEAGVSKQTVYNHFHSKESLFKAIVEKLSAGLATPLGVRDASTGRPEDLLRDFGRELLGLMLRPSSLALHRLIVAESARFPELGGAVYAVGTGRLIEMLSDYLAWETRNRRLDVADPVFAAEQFIGMLSGRVQLRALLGVCAAPDEAEIGRRVDAAVAGFLTLHAPAPVAASAATA